jgi:hypothetical protein
MVPVIVTMYIATFYKIVIHNFHTNNQSTANSVYISLFRDLLRFYRYGIRKFHPGLTTKPKTGGQKAQETKKTLHASHT